MITEEVTFKKNHLNSLSRLLKEASWPLAVSSIISDTRGSVSSAYPNTEKRVGNTTCSGVLLTNFEVFG